MLLSTYCHSCSLKRNKFGEDAAVFNNWYMDNCSINYHGSANAMEVEAAKRLWGCSVATTGLTYTGFLGDGDSKAYQAVVTMAPYGPNITIVKKECVIHAHKRMGTALLKLAKEQKLGGRGHGRLTKEKAIRPQHYYRYTITQDVNRDVDSMRTRV